MKALQYFKQAVAVEQGGEDGSGLLSLLCDAFELAQLNSAIDMMNPYRYLVDEAQVIKRSVSRRVA